jgi:hypothetical protein
MAISYVAEAQYVFTGTANTDARVTIPSGIQTGDLMVCAFGNVASQSVAATMNNSWTKLEEDTSGTNCYFLMAAKIATSGDVTNAGTDVSLATLNSSTGQTNKTCQSMAYRGTEATVGAAVIDSAFTHESSPADETINTNSVTSTDAAQWYVCFFNMAAGNTDGDQTADTFTSTGVTFRGHAPSYNSGATNSVTAGGDSNGTVAVQSWNRNGTWSGNSTRLNAAIMIIDPAISNETADAGAATVVAATNAGVAGVGAKAQVIG